MSNIMPIIIFSLMAREVPNKRMCGPCNVWDTPRISYISTSKASPQDPEIMWGGLRKPGLELDAPMRNPCTCDECLYRVQLHRAGTIDKTQRAKSKRVPPKRDKTLYNDILIDPTVLEHYKWHKSGKLAPASDYDIEDIMDDIHTLSFVLSADYRFAATSATLRKLYDFLSTSC